MRKNAFPRKKAITNLSNSMNDITYYPNPLKRRERTVILNDGFLFSFDNRSWQKINVPYCPESKLSGIGYTDFIPECFYKKKFTVEKNRERVVLNFGAVDYMASVFKIGRASCRERV